VYIGRSGKNSLNFFLGGNNLFQAQDIVIDGMTIRLVGAPHFLGIKLFGRRIDSKREAFKRRFT
jgi:hypothetical protein